MLALHHEGQQILLTHWAPSASWGEQAGVCGLHAPAAHCSLPSIAAVSSSDMQRGLVWVHRSNQDAVCSL